MGIDILLGIILVGIGNDYVCEFGFFIKNFKVVVDIVVDGWMEIIDLGWI